MVLPEDAERIALAQNEGKLTLALRNPLDVSRPTTQGIRMAALLRAAGPQPVIDPVANKVVQGAGAASQRRRRIAADPTVYRVETIRAAKRGEEEVEHE